MPMEFDTLVAYFDADLTPLKAKAKQADKIVDDLEARFKKMKLDFGGGKEGVASAKRQADSQVKAYRDAEKRANQEARADMRRMQVERARIERENTRAVERESRNQARAREKEFKRSMNQIASDSKKNQKTQSGFFSGTRGNSLLGGAIGGAAFSAFTGITGGVAQLATEGRDAYISLDKLVRFTATLDQRFQAPQFIAKFTKDIENLSQEKLGQTAENIAKASFTIKSAYQNLTEPELIDFLRKFAVQATASNTTIDQHTERVAAMAKMYGITATELDNFGALMATTFGAALASDSAVGEGFNKILVSARTVKQPLNEVAAAMSAIQSTSSDAEKNTTNLQNVFSKLSDPKYIAGFKETFNIDVFDAQGKYKGLNQIVNELAKSLQGLSDKEKSAKIGEVFKDLQAREGLMSLIDVLEMYNKTLRDGADADAWAGKQKTMLDSAEVRWQQFGSFVDQIQRDIGKKISDPVVKAQSSETGTGSAALALGEVQNSIATGGTRAIMQVKRMGDEFNFALLEAFGAKPSTIEGMRAAREKMFADMLTGNEQMQRAQQTAFLNTQKEYFEKIASDPSASEALRAQARTSVENLTREITVLAQQYGQVQFDQFKTAYEEAAKGLEAADPAIQQAAKESSQKLQLQMAQMIDSKTFEKLTPEMKTDVGKLFRSVSEAAEKEVTAGGAGVKSAMLGWSALFGPAGIYLGQVFGSSVGEGIGQKKGEIGTATTEAMQGDPAAAQAQGQPIGSNFGSGIAAGIRASFGLVGLAVESLVDYMHSKGQQAQDSHSPSRRAAEELGLPFVQGIEVGILGREKSLSNTVSGVINRAMFSGPKGKKGKGKADEAIRDLLTGLGMDSSRIGAEASRSEAATDRFYDALLADHTSDFDTQAATIDDFYTKIYDTEEQAYQKRLVNISQREDAIRQLKKIKETERARELQKLADERADVEADREQSRFENLRDRTADIAAAGQRQIEQMQRALARELKVSDINRVGGFGSSEDEAKQVSQERLQLIDAEISRQRDLANSLTANSKARVDVENKIKDLFEQRKDAEVEGMAEIKQARDEDRQNVQEYYRELSDLAGQTREAEFEASEARINLMRESGAREKDVFDAEIQLERDREGFRHEQRQMEITALAQDLVNRAQNRDEILRIEQEFNHMMETETNRHNSVMGQLTAQQGQNSILGQWKQIADHLPKWQDQLKDFAVSLPNVIGDSFGQALQQFDGTWHGFLDSLKTAFFRTIQEMLAELFRTQIIKLLVQLGTSIAGGFGGGGVDSATGNINDPSFLHFASGGAPPVGRASIVGENGPELFVPSTKGRILSNEDSKSALSGAGRGNTINNVVVNHNYRAPRMLVAPRSVRQNTESTLAGVAAGTRK